MGRTIIHSVKLFDGIATFPNATVIFESDTGLIVSVNTTLSETNLENTNVIDGTGHTLLPGLIEGHMHAHALHLPEGADNSSLLRSPLKCGITTVCDMHTDPPTIERLRNEVLEDYKTAEKSGVVELSDLKSSLLGATIEGGWPKPIVLGHDPTDRVSR
jgi:dihydroorotase-like cyclic amidohydrolase